MSYLSSSIVTIIVVLTLTLPKVSVANDAVHGLARHGEPVWLAQSKNQIRKDREPSRDAVVRAAKKRMPGSKVLKLEQEGKGGSARYRARVLTPDGKVKVIKIAPGDL